MHELVLCDNQTMPVLCSLAVMALSFSPMTSPMTSKPLSHSRAVLQLQAPPPPVQPKPPSSDEQAKLTKLLVSVLIDILGIATYALPAVGEVGDIAWAPVSAYLVYSLYGNGLVAGLAFAEELLPGLDIIPTATIAWLLENTEVGQNINAQAPSSSAPPSSWQPRKSSEAEDRDTATGGDTGMKRAEPERWRE